MVDVVVVVVEVVVDVDVVVVNFAVIFLNNAVTFCSFKVDVDVVGLVAIVITGSVVTKENHWTGNLFKMGLFLHLFYSFLSFPTVQYRFKKKLGSQLRSNSYYGSSKQMG